MVNARTRAFCHLLLHDAILALLFRCEIAIGFALFEETIRRVSVLRRICRLEDEILVVVESEPLETFDDRARRLIGRALQIRVFYAKEKLAADLSRVEPVEESGTCGADVQVAGWGGCETYSNRHEPQKVCEPQKSTKVTKDLTRLVLCFLCFFVAYRLLADFWRR